MRLGFVAVTLICLAAGCHERPGGSRTPVDRRLSQVMPEGWRLIRAGRDEVPFEHGPVAGSLSGQKLLLVGPRRMEVTGYYCSGSMCTRPAREAIEIWVMPEDYSDESMPSLMAWRTPELLVSSGDMQIYASASRDVDGRATFDANFNGTSSETPTLPPRQDGDLPVSWVMWKEDIRRALADG